MIAGPPPPEGGGRPSRQNQASDIAHRVPVHVVWELTLACNLKCVHCGSRAGQRRPRELTTGECLEVVRRLARLGTREISLIGGEAYLRPDWTDIIREIRGHDIFCVVQTGGRGLTSRRLQDAIDAGLQGLGVSIDGPRDVHDAVRGVAGSYDAAIDALRRAKAAGLGTSANTVVMSNNLRVLPEIMDAIIGAGATHWQVQLAVGMGNAVDHPEILLQPYQVLELAPLLARLHREGEARGLMLTVGNNVGYFGPHERLWRDHFGEEVHWGGCAAGRTVAGLEADGTLKGCPSLATERYAAGNVLETPLEELWAQAEPVLRNERGAARELWGFCKTCYYAEACRGGCTWTADSLLGRPGNNPYCHYRALALEKRGLRERVVRRREAPDTPFATGRFELILEPMPDREPLAGGNEAHTTGDAAAGPARPPGSVATELVLCRACDCFIWADETTCPHCGADVRLAEAAHRDDVRRRNAIVEDVLEWVRLRSLDG